MTADNLHLNSIPDYMDTAETAAFLRISPRTLARLNVLREGPPQIRYDRKILYKRTSVIAWLDSREQPQVRADRGPLTARRGRRAAPAQRLKARRLRVKG